VPYLIWRTSRAAKQNRCRSAQRNPQASKPPGVTGRAPRRGAARLFGTLLCPRNEPTQVESTSRRRDREGRKMSRLEGKVAIITGAGGGIGSAAARLFAREGARLILADVSGEEEAAAREIG